MSPRRVLLVFPASKEDTANLVSQLLRTKVFTPELQGEVLWVPDETKAREALSRDPYHLIITDIHIPPDSMSLVSEAEERGLLFLQTLEKAQVRIPSLLVAVDPPTRFYQAAQDLPDCRIIPEDDQLSQGILKHSKNFLSQEVIYSSEPDRFDVHQVKEAAAPGPDRKIANIEITINIDKKEGDEVLGRYEIHGFGFNYWAEGVIRIDYDTLNTLKEMSKDVEKAKDWKEKLSQVGTTLSGEIEKGKKFKEDFEAAMHEVGSIQNMRIRFKVKKDDAYAVILEALTSAEKEFLMLQAPIYRKVDISRYSGHFPLFFDPDTRKGPLNCLIIEAEAEGYVPETDTYEPKLTHLRKETDWIRRHLKKLQKASLKEQAGLKIGKIVRFPEKKIPRGQKFSDLLMELLTKAGPWHLVHYAGHSRYQLKIVNDEKVGAGYFIFPGPDKKPEPVKVSEFSHYFRVAGTRFLYLSSCHSAAAEFVFELANNLIPAILGFRWAVEDNRALHHAQRFYSHLFDLKSVDQAFLESRQDMFEEDEKDRMWAAPLLIMQISSQPPG